MKNPTIQETLDAYLDDLTVQRSSNTVRTYRNAINAFTEFLDNNGIDTQKAMASAINSKWATHFIDSLRGHSSASKQVYSYAVLGWLKFVEKQGIVEFDFESIRRLQRELRDSSPDQSFAQNHEDLSRFVGYAARLGESEDLTELSRLQALRDRALIITIADTSIDISSVCQLCYGDVDWVSRSFEIQKGANIRERVVFSPRVEKALRDYLDARSDMTPQTYKIGPSLPLFARHRVSGERTVQAVSTGSVRRIISRRTEEAFGSSYRGSITPKSLKLYRVSSLLESFKLLHHKVIEECQVQFEHGLYDQAVFSAMKLIEVEIRVRTGAERSEPLPGLLTKAFHSKDPLFHIRSIDSEQDGIYFLFRGAIAAIRNPLGHHTLNLVDPTETYEYLAFASLLLRILDSIEQT